MLSGLNFVMVHVNDIEEARNFYTEQLGLEVEGVAPNFVQFKQPGGNGATFAISHEPGIVPAQGNDIELWWFVDNADAVYAELRARGVEIAQEAKDEPFGRTFAIKDPSGNILYMLQLRQ
ncbi:MAG TPA: VOC family protein [Ktedonobacteraceae bacterium]|nr:VOC family protein [Ktedonobacteraceae bacterium]